MAVLVLMRLAYLRLPPIPAQQRSGMTTRLCCGRRPVITPQQRRDAGFGLLQAAWVREMQFADHGEVFAGIGGGVRVDGRGFAATNRERQSVVRALEGVDPCPP